MIEKFNIYSKLPVDKKNEKFFQILKSDNIRIEKIVSNGQNSLKNFWYDQKESEFIMLLKGEAILELIEDDIKEVHLKEGDYLDIKAHVKHRVKYTSQTQTTVWLAVFY